MTESNTIKAINEVYAEAGINKNTCLTPEIIFDMCPDFVKKRILNFIKSNKDKETIFAYLDKTKSVDWQVFNEEEKNYIYKKCIEQNNKEKNGDNKIKTISLVSDWIRKKIEIGIKKGYGQKEIFNNLLQNKEWQKTSDEEKQLTYDEVKSEIELKQNEDEETKEEQEENKKFEENIVSYPTLKKEEVPTNEWIVEQFLPQKDITLISGKTGCFKTAICLHLAYCVSTGKLVFNKFATKKCNVLYFDAENDKRIIKPRLLLIENNLKEEAKGLFYTFDFSFDLMNDTHLKRLEKIIIEKQIGLVIFDSYGRFILFDVNKADETNKLYKEKLKPLRERTGANIVLIAHHRKTSLARSDISEQIGGSFEFVNNCDSHIVISRYGRGNILNIEQSKNRFLPELAKSQINVLWDKDSLGFEYTGLVSELINTKEKKCQNKLLELFKKESDKQFKTKEIKELLVSEEFSESLVEKSLKKLLEDGQIENRQTNPKVKYGCYKLFVETQSNLGNDFGIKVSKETIKEGGEIGSS